MTITKLQLEERIVDALEEEYGHRLPYLSLARAVMRLLERVALEESAGRPPIWFGDVLFWALSQDKRDDLIKRVNTQLRNKPTGEGIVTIVEEFLQEQESERQ